MKSFFFHLSRIFLIIIFIACSPVQNSAKEGSEKMPKWINNPSKEFPSSQFITAVGSGDTRQDAENSAYGNLAKIFKVDVTVNERLLEQYLEENVNGEYKSTFSSLMSGKTSVRTNQQLKNITIERAFFAEKETVYYALAVLDRAETAALYKTEIERNNNNIDDSYQRYQDENDLLRKLKYINKSLSLTTINNVLNEQLDLIAGTTLKLAKEENQLLADKNSLMEKIPVSIHALKQSNSDVKDFISQALSEIGFKMTENEGKIDFKYNLDARYVDLNRPNTYALNWDISIEMIEVSTQKSLQTFTKNNRTAAINEQAARARMLLNVKKIVMQDFKNQVVSYINAL